MLPTANGSANGSASGPEVVVVAPPPTKPLLADTGHQRLRQLIVTLELDPGAAIDERALTLRLGVGRTPLREAIQRLTHEGLIVQAPRRGRWVAPLSVTDLGQMIETRGLIEPQVARLAAVRARPAQVDRLGAILDEAEGLIGRGDFAGTVFLDQRFHCGIADAAGNRHLAGVAERLIHELVRYWYASFLRVGGLDQVFPHHRQLLAAIADHDAGAAERLSRQHVDLFRDRMRDLAAGPLAPAAGAFDHPHADGRGPAAH